MSLAMFAAPVDENNEHQINNNDNNIMNKKRRTHNRTQKANTTENFTTNKVNSILNEIYSNMGEDGEDVPRWCVWPERYNTYGIIWLVAINLHQFQIQRAWYSAV